MLTQVLSQPLLDVKIIVFARLVNSFSRETTQFPAVRENVRLLRFSPEIPQESGELNGPRKIPKFVTRVW